MPGFAESMSYALVEGGSVIVADGRVVTLNERKDGFWFGPEPTLVGVQGLGMPLIRWVKGLTLWRGNGA